MSRETAMTTTTGDGALVQEEGGESVVELEIERTRERILASLQRLRSEVSDATDWRKQYARRPWVFVAGALGLGLLLGMTIGTRKEIRT